MGAGLEAGLEGGGGGGVCRPAGHSRCFAGHSRCFDFGAFPWCGRILDLIFLVAAAVFPCWDEILRREFSGLSDIPRGGPRGGPRGLVSRGGVEVSRLAGVGLGVAGRGGISDSRLLATALKLAVSGGIFPPGAVRQRAFCRERLQARRVLGGCAGVQRNRRSRTSR